MALSRARSKRDRWLFIATAAVALVPLVVAAVRALHGSWVPVGDNALYAIRARDVFTAHPPLIGMFSSLSGALGRAANNPGPLHFDLVAPPARLLGDAGIVIGVTLVNGFAVVGAAVVAYRRGGPLVGTAAAMVGALLSWVMGSQLLFEPFPSHSPVLPFLLFCVLVWSVASGDADMLPWAAGVGTLVLQTHLSYAILVPALAAWAVLGLTLELRRRWRADPASWPSLRRRTQRAVVLAAVVLAVCWAQPVIEQLTSRVGNLRRLGRVSGDPVEALGTAKAFRLVASVTTQPPWSFRAVLEDAAPSLAATVVGLGALIALLGAAAWGARRRSDRLGVHAVITAIVLLAAGVVTATRAPLAASLRASTFEVAPQHVQWLWVITAFTLFAVLVNVAPPAEKRARLSKAVLPTLVLATGLLALLNLPSEDQGAVGPAAAMPFVRDLRPEIATLQGEGPLLVVAPGGFDAFGPPVMAELQRQGIRFVTDNAVLLRQLGDHRRFDGDNAQAVLHVVTGPSAGRPPEGARRIALREGLTPDERRELLALEAQLGRYIQDGRMRFSERGEAALESGFPTSFVDDPSGRTVDLGSVFYTRELLASVWSGLLVLEGVWDDRFERYAHLRDRADTLTVGLHLGELDQ